MRSVGIGGILAAVVVFVISVPVASFFGALAIFAFCYDMAMKAGKSPARAPAQGQTCQPDPASNPAGGADNGSFQPPFGGPVIEVPYVGPSGHGEESYDVADYYVSIIFNDSFTASVGIFEKHGIAKRRLRAIDSAAVKLMNKEHQGESYNFPDYRFSGPDGVENALQDTERLGVRFIEELLKLEPRPSKVLGEVCSAPLVPSSVTNGTRQATSSGGVEANVRQFGREPPPAPGAATSPPPIKAAAEAKVSRTPVGTATGEVIDMGMRKLLKYDSGQGNDRGGANSCFEAVLQCDDGETRSYRGVRLEEHFAEQGVQLHDRIEIQSLGRTLVSIHGEERGKYRNEFVVKVLQRA